MSLSILVRDDGSVRLEREGAEPVEVTWGQTPTPPTPTPLPPFNLQDVTVLGSNQACLQFPAVATLDRFALDGASMLLATTGTADWPAVPVDANDNTPSQVATLWVFLRIGGQWYATGAERLKASQVNGSKPEGDPATLIGRDWLFDQNRWGVMAGYNPSPGEQVGVMVVSGSTRSDDQTPVRERSNVLMVAWPA